jgi:CPA2 family monovalent cation:H+ antiporter-2
MVLKALAVYPLARVFGLNRRNAIETAAILGPAGEFAFVIVDEAIGRHILAPDIGQAVILSATLSLFFVPLLAALSGRIAGRLAPSDPPPSEAPETVGEASPVIIVGYGRVGALVADMLTAHEIGFTVIDINPRVVARARAAGIQAWYGDASVPDLMERMGLAKARAVVVTASNAAFTDSVVQAVHGARPDVHVIARARDAGHADRLGATDAVPETIEASLQLAENTLIDLGVPMGLVLASVHEQRDVFRRMFGVRSGPAVVRMRGEA